MYTTIEWLCKQGEVETIRDEFLSDDAAKQISALSEKYDVEKAEKKKYKNLHSKVEERLQDSEKKHNADKEILTKTLVQSDEVQEEKKNLDKNLASIKEDLKTMEEGWNTSEECLASTSNQLKQEKEEKDSIKQELAAIKKQFKEVQNENKNWYFSKALRIHYLSTISQYEVMKMLKNAH